MRLLGAQVRVARRTSRASKGLPPDFAKDWGLPPTANVYGTPNGQDNGIPPAVTPTGNGAFRSVYPLPAETVTHWQSLNK